MKILVDARLLHGGGIGRWLREVGSRWLGEPEIPRIRFLGRPEELAPWLADHDARDIGEIVPCPFPPYSPRFQATWAARAESFRGEADVAFFPHYDAPLIRHPASSLVMVHDLTQYLLPGSFPRGKRIAGRLLLNGALRRATRVVTVSERSRADLEAWGPELKGRVDVVYPGVSEIFRSPDDGERGAAAELVRSPFLLMVGSSRPHKNLALGAEILGRLGRGRPDLRLAVVGPVGGPRGPLAAAAEAHGVADRIVALGTVDDVRLRELYGGAEAFLFPSLYEGFGIPPLEAMACGTAVVASDRGALPEVLGEHAVLVDPARPEEWARRLEEILDSASSGVSSPAGSRPSEAHPEREANVRNKDEGPNREETARHLRVQHARSFSWDRAAEALLRILGEVVSGPKSP